MHTLPGYLQNLKQRLLKEKSESAAWAVIDEYFHYISLESIKEELWILTKGTITNDLMDQSDIGVGRHDLIFGYEFQVLVMEAVHQLYDIRNGTNSNE